MLLGPVAPAAWRESESASESHDASLQTEGDQNAPGGGGALRLVVATSLRHLCKNKSKINKCQIFKQF